MGAELKNLQIQRHHNPYDLAVVHLDPIDEFKGL